MRVVSSWWATRTSNPMLGGGPILGRFDSYSLSPYIFKGLSFRTQSFFMPHITFPGLFFYFFYVSNKAYSDAELIFIFQHYVNHVIVFYF